MIPGLILLYPYPYKTFAVLVTALVFLIIGMPLYGIHRLIIRRMGERSKPLVNRVLLFSGILLLTFFFTGMTLSLIKIHQVNQQLGFRYATPETATGEHLIITRVERGKPMDEAGLRAGDRICLTAVDELYAMLVNNQGHEVEIPVLRDSIPEVIKVSVPELHILDIKFWPFNAY